MKKEGMIFVCLVLMLFLFGCANQSSGNKLADKASEKMVESTVQQAEQAAEEAQEEINQEKINFKCTIANVETFYFLKDKAKIEIGGRESWLNDDGYFAKMEVNEDYYLVQYPEQESEMTLEAMQANYQFSLTSDVYDCELDVVTEAIVTPPDLEIITPEEMAEIILEGVANMYS